MSILNFRRYARAQVEIPIQFTPKNAKQPVAAYVNNLSEEGASLISPFAIPIAMTVNFDLVLEPGKPPVHIQGEVLWARPVKDEGRDVFAHGLMLQKMTVEDRHRLHEYISGTMSY